MTVFGLRLRRPHLLAALVVLASGAAAAGWHVFAQAEPPPRYRAAKIDAGPIVSAVSATGSVNPVVTVLVGSQLSGQIKQLLVDFNTPVQSGQVIARLDAEHIEARMAQARADLQAARAALAMQEAQAERTRAELDSAQANVASARAQIARAEALLKEAERDLERRRALLGRGAATAADADKAQTAVETSRAELAAARAQQEAAAAAQAGAQAALRVSQSQIAAARAQLAQREAAVQQVQVDLDNAEIRSPIDGVVIQRSVDVGQTVAASFQAPELFKIAQDLKRIEVWASIDEGDIGRVAPGQEVTFTVNAYPGTIFRGDVAQVRLGPQTIQNVVTYTTVIAAENPDLKLLPGMTATVRIVTERRDSALRVPNAALRWRPPSAAAQGESDLGASLRGGAFASEAFAEKLGRELGLSAEQQRELDALSAEARADLQALRAGGLTSDQARNRIKALRQTTIKRVTAMLTPEQQARFEEIRAQQASNSEGAPGRVWVPGRDGQPRAVPLRLGISDGGVTEVLAGDLAAGQEVIVGGGASRASAPAAGPRLGF